MVATGENKRRSQSGGYAMSEDTLNRAVLDIEKQLTGLAACQKQLLAANNAETLDLALRAIEHRSGVLRASASSLRFSAGFAQDRRNSGGTTSSDVEPDRVTMRALLKSRGVG
jgi:hypothetical protein